MKFSGNGENGPRNGGLNFGDVLPSGGTLTFDPLKIMLFLLDQKRGAHVNQVNDKGILIAEITHFSQEGCVI